MRARARVCKRGGQKKLEFIPHIEYRDKLEYIYRYFHATNMAIHITKFISSTSRFIPHTLNTRNTQRRRHSMIFKGYFAGDLEDRRFAFQINSRVDPFLSRSFPLRDFSSVAFLCMFRHALGKKRVLMIEHMSRARNIGTARQSE